MALLGIDLGGTKLRLAIFTKEGELVTKESLDLEKRKGSEVGFFIRSRILKYLDLKGPSRIESIGVSVPGISSSKTRTVWAPNIPGWEDYPLLNEIKLISGNIPVTIESDRACYILGEWWKGNAKGSKNAIFLSVGTGIGAGIMVNGTILRGANGIAGSVGWLALDKRFKDKYKACGCFEYHASGEGIAKVAEEILKEQKSHQGRKNLQKKITAKDVFAAYDKKEPWAIQVIENAIKYWGMGVANLISIFNPEKIIFGGGVFGPGLQLLGAIKEEAAKWAQPISMTKVGFEKSALGGDSGIYGAGYLALKNLH